MLSSSLESQCPTREFTSYLDGVSTLRLNLCQQKLKPIYNLVDPSEYLVVLDTRGGLNRH